MPEKTDNINKIKNDCEKVKFTADEYLHGEFSEESEEKEFIEKHIIDCEDCRQYIAEEKLYLDEIKNAEYFPEISISQFVMDKIIEEKRIVDKPPRKRFIPIGFISAAAVVVIMFMITRGGPLKMFMKASQDNANNAVGGGDSADISYTDNAKFGTYSDDNILIDGANEIGGASDAQTQAQIQQFDGAMGKMLPDSVIEENEETNEEAGEDQVAEVAPAAMPEAFAIKMPEAEYMIPEAVNEADSMFRVEEMDEYIPEISGLDMNQIYEIYYIGTGMNGKDEIRANAVKDIEIYKTDEERGSFDIIDKKYKNTLNQNLEENNIAISEILSKNKDGEYIAVVYWFN